MLRRLGLNVETLEQEVSGRAEPALRMVVKEWMFNYRLNKYQSAQESLTALLYGEKQTSMFIELLLDMDLIVPLTLEITLASGANKTIQGLYSIDEDKLNALNNSQLNKLHTSGFLQSAFTQVASLGQIYRLIELKNQRDAAPDVLMQ